MKAKIRWLVVPILVVPTLVLGYGGALRAQGKGEPRKAGKVLLLKTGLAMEGDIEQVGTQICVRHGVSEVWITADRVVRLCPDWNDAYAFMHTLIKADSAADRVKLARWCHLHRLNQEALEQAKVALELQPDHADAKLIVTMLEREKREGNVRPTPTAQTPAAKPQPASDPARNVDVTADTLVAFMSRVQPILMNTCASCHLNETNGNFRLERVSEHGYKGATQQNLATVLAYVDLERPAISPILVKAITPHGRDTLPAIRDRSAKPFQTMQDWIVETLKKNPQLKDYHAARKSPAAAVSSEAKTSVVSSAPAAPLLSGSVVSQTMPRLEITATSSPAAKEMRTPMLERDWCDAEHFNAWAHPKR